MRDNNSNLVFSPCQVWYEILDDGFTPDQIMAIDLIHPPKIQEGKYSRIAILSTQVSASGVAGNNAICSLKKGYIDYGDGKTCISQRMIITYGTSKQAKETLTIDFYTIEQNPEEFLNGTLQIMARNFVHAGDSPVLIKEVNVNTMQVSPGSACLNQAFQASKGPNGLLENQVVLMSDVMPLIANDAFNIYLQNIKLNKNQNTADLNNWFDGLSSLYPLTMLIAGKILASKQPIQTNTRTGVQYHDSF